jgi:hypothetical protein
LEYQLSIRRTVLRIITFGRDQVSVCDFETSKQNVGWKMTERPKQPRSRREPDADLPNALWVVNGGAEAGAFRLAMRRIVGGVTVITTRHDDQPWGMMLLACVNNCTASDISRNGLFAVSLLSLARLNVSQRCARSGKDKYLTDHVVPPNELPDRVVMPALRNSIVIAGQLRYGRSEVI